MFLEEAVPLDQRIEEDYRSYFFYGPPGVGKTTLALKHHARRPKYGGRILYADIDAKLHELEIPKEIRDRVTVWTPGVPLAGQNVETAKIDRTRTNPTAGKLISEPPLGYRKIVGLVNELLALAYKKEFPFDAFVLDSLTRVSDHMTYLVQYEHGVSIITESLYEVVKRNYKELIWGILRLPCDRIVIAHSKHIEKRDKRSNVIIESITKPNTVGSFNEEIMSYFTEGYYFPGCLKDSKDYMIQTANDGTAQARTGKSKLRFLNSANPDEVFA